MPTNNKSIQILRGTTTNSGESNVDKTILETGQPFYDKRTNTLRIGHDNKTINSTAPITVDDGAITTSKLHTGAVTTDKLHDASNASNPTGITTRKIENNAVDGTKIAAGSIDNTKVARDADIDGSKFKRNSIWGNRLADANGDNSNPSGITNGKIENNAITTDKILDKAITPAKIDPEGNYTLNYLIVKKDGEDTGILEVQDTLTIGKEDNSTQFYPDKIQLNSNSTVRPGTGKGVLHYPDLGGDGDTIAVLSNIPKFQSTGGNLYITT